MADVVVIPDSEAIVIDYFNANADVVDVLEGGAHGNIPHNAVYPFAVVRRYGGFSPRPGWLDRARIQIDVWGTDRASTERAAATCKAALEAMPQAQAGVVTAVEEIVGLQRLDDLATNHSRYFWAAGLVFHPVQSSI